MNRKLVVFDDDPTGIQTVHGCLVLTTWDEATLTAAFQDKISFFYILTNIRALPLVEAKRVLSEACRMVSKISQKMGIDVKILSRSDSTLRSHFPLEIDLFMQFFAADTSVNGIIFAPAFFESGRITADNIHYVVEKDNRIPAHKTEFAQDPDFPYSTASLPDYIQEKVRAASQAGNANSIRTSGVVSISLDLIRNGGAEEVSKFLQKIGDGSFIVVNAESYDDIDIVTAAIRCAEENGKRFFYHTSSSFVRSFMQQDAKLLDLSSVNTGPGLVVVGSYVKKTQQQVRKLLQLQNVEGIPLAVDEIVMHSGEQRQITLSRINEIISKGKTAVLYLERKSVSSEIQQGEVWDIGQKITAFFCSCVIELPVKPSFVLGKGGITSHELLKNGLQVPLARVKGQAVPGVPVIQMNEGHRFSGMYYVIFPGNVGSDDTLAEVVSRLSDASYKNGK